MHESQEPNNAVRQTKDGSLKAFSRYSVIGMRINNLRCDEV